MLTRNFDWIAQRFYVHAQLRRIPIRLRRRWWITKKPTLMTCSVGSVETPSLRAWLGTKVSARFMRNFMWSNTKSENNKAWIWTSEKWEKAVVAVSWWTWKSFFYLIPAASRELLKIADRASFMSRAMFYDRNNTRSCVVYGFFIRRWPWFSYLSGACTATCFPCGLENEKLSCEGGRAEEEKIFEPIPIINVEFHFSSSWKIEY